MTTIFEYYPCYVKIPFPLKKDFSNQETIPPITQKIDEDHSNFSTFKSTLLTNHLVNKKMKKNYDDYSLFYDVFFDYKRDNIWAIGPPLLSLKEKIFPFKIFYKKQEISYNYWKTEGFDYNTSCHFQIPASKIKEQNPTLTFIGKNWKFSCVVASFPPIKNNNITLTTLQKDYSAKHIIDWIKWHYRNHGIQSIFLYDNGSDNVLEVINSIKKLEFLDLEIIFIHWNYYYGGLLGIEEDLFAQGVQLNHTHKFFFHRGRYIGSWDMDELLVYTGNNLFKELKKPYLNLAGYDVVDIEKKVNRIKDCCFRNKKMLKPDYKYFYYSQSIRFFDNPHFIKLRHIISYFFIQKIKYIIIRILNKIEKVLKLNRSKKIYIIHLIPIKVDVRRNNKDKRTYLPFNPNLHIKDKGIIQHIKIAKL